ncbi:MAG: alpha/beta hydrolase [Chloroflexi bacterium]|nr:alpha/beta hydrolase [Chloroflexota bacterium]
METKLVERQWTTVGDCQVAYRQWGEEGKPVVLLHGLPTNSALWARVGRRLSAQGYRVYAPEMLGLGYTDGPEDHDHSLRGQAQLLSRFVNAVVRDEYVLVGHDLGGGVAQIMMTEPSTPVDKVVLTNCVAFDSWPVEGVKPLIGGAYHENYARIFTPEFTLDFLRKGLSAGLLDTGVITDDLLEDLCQGLVGTKQRLEHFARFLRAMDNKYTQAASPQLTKFERETLVVWARGDRFQPVPVGERLREVLPNATWVLIDGGHFHPLESVGLAEAILRWDSGK